MGIRATQAGVIRPHGAVVDGDADEVDYASPSRMRRISSEARCLSSRKDSISDGISFLLTAEERADFRSGELGETMPENGVPPGFEGCIVIPQLGERVRQQDEAGRILFAGQHR